MKYVIHKISRAPGLSSYSGSTWDKAGIRKKYREQFSNRWIAEKLAVQLSRYNPVGFTVSPRVGEVLR